MLANRDKSKLYTKKLYQVSIEDIGIAGGKASSLGELIRINIPVPRGFVILTDAFNTFISANNLKTKLAKILSELDYDNTTSLNTSSRKIQNIIINGKVPVNITLELYQSFDSLNSKYVAVRSSAIMEDSTSSSWAGQLESYLNIKKEDLIDNIKKCWASLYSSNSILYGRLTKNQNDQNSIAVIIQEMIQPDVTGVAFSIDPVVNDERKAVIEAVKGSFNLVVSGETIPERYSINKDTNHIESSSITKAKNILNRTQIESIQRKIINIENHFGFPVDIEWGLKGNKCYIFQSRPITTHEPQGDIKEEQHYDLKGKWIKHWSGKWSILLSTLLGYQYTRTLEKQLGVSFNNVVFIAKNGIVDCYLNKDEYQHFGSYLAKLVIKDTTVATKWCSDLIESTNVFLDFIDNFSYSDFNVKYFNQFLDKFYKYGVSHRAVKIVVDFLPEKLLKELINDFDYSRKYSEPVYRKADDFLNQIAELYCTGKNIAKNDILSLCRNEFLKLIEDDSLSQMNELSKRYNKSAIIFTNMSELIVDGTLVDDIENEILFIPNNNFILKGTPAYPGRVKGVARIVFDPEKAKDFKKGEILITGMTRPEFTHLIYLSSAIITDAGGILSHAAITARELKKPCIVGTEIATKVLKDGDLILVDAYNGVINLK